MNRHGWRRYLSTCVIPLVAGAGCSLPGVWPSRAAEPITAGLIARGQPHVTPYFIQDSGQPGPTVFIIGGMHGNEPAGAAAAGQIRHWQITRGRLVVVPRANPPALAANTRGIPGEPTAAANLNRNFPRADAPDETPRGPIAEAIWEFVCEIRPDWVLDLHEGYDFHAANQSSVGSSIIHLNDEETTPHVERMLATVNAEVAEPEKQLVSIPRGPVNSGLVRAAIAHLQARGMILETTWKEQPLSLRTRQHRLMVHRFLSDLDMVAHGPEVRPPVPVTEGRGRAADGRLHVALYDGPGTGGEGVPNITSIVRGMPEATVTLVGPADIRDRVLDLFDVVVFPGGSARAQGQAIREAGRDHVREFVRSGGGYLGICAGAYLGTCRLEQYLSMVRAFHYSPWERGEQRVDIELTEYGRDLLGMADQPGPFDVRYANGPLFFHEAGLVPDLDLPAFEVVARFRSGTTWEGQVQEVMVDTPAIVSAEFGRGRCILISPHPESDDHRWWLVEQAVRWVAGRGLGETRPRHVAVGSKLGLAVTP